MMLPFHLIWLMAGEMAPASPQIDALPYANGGSEGPGSCGGCDMFGGRGGGRVMTDRKLHGGTKDTIRYRCGCNIALPLTTRKQASALDRDPATKRTACRFGEVGGTQDPD
jgi:hypothetical protein